MKQRELFDDDDTDDKLVDDQAEVDVDDHGLLWTRMLVTKDGIDLEARTVDVIASTDTLDSHGDIVEQIWNLERFNANPVVLFAHKNRELPIGFASNTGVRDGVLKSTLNFVDDKANPLAEQVLQSFKQKSLRAVSVGFMPGEIRIEDDGAGGMQFILSKNELHEISPVPIPSNPETLAELKQRAIAAYQANGKTRAAIPAHAPTAVDIGTWKGGEAKKRLRTWASADGSGDPGSIDFEKFQLGFAWFDASAPEKVASYKLPHHDIKDGELVTVRSGIIAAGKALTGSGGAGIPEEEIPAVRRHLARHFRQFDLTPPWEQDKAAERGRRHNQMDQEKALAEANESIVAKQAELDTERSKAVALQSRCDDLDGELTKANVHVKELAGKLVDKELAELVGTKMNKAEVDGIKRLAELDHSVYVTQLDAIKARPDLPTAQSDAMGADPNKKRGTSVQTDIKGVATTSGGTGLAARIEARNSAQA